MTLLDSWCGADGASALSCGWAAAFLAVLAWGSFGVPIRAVPHSLQVHPLVMQSYKTLVCFVTSFLFVALAREPVRWSWWGLLSGLFWVPGATAGIYGIRQAGLAVAVGTWSSIIVMTSSFFGIVVFRESVKDVGDAIRALLILVLGLIGMAHYSASSTVEEGHLPPPLAHKALLSVPSHRRSRSSQPLAMSETADALSSMTSLSKRPSRAGDGGLPFEIDEESARSEGAAAARELNPGDAGSDEEEYDDELAVMLGVGSLSSVRRKDKVGNSGRLAWRWLYCWRIVLTPRQLGVLGAVVNGGWGGMNLIPLHYAKKYDGLSGAAYVVSFGGGAVIVTVAMFGAMYLYHIVIQGESWRAAFDCLPKWHFREMGGRGLLAGILYSVGNFASILAVTFLGQSIGYSACQMQLFVSGLWGVFYFQEITSRIAIVKWFLSAAAALTGILWLAYERGSSSR
jgi:glucose uptake protein GlcU